jgi:hypothetical protein
MANEKRGVSSALKYESVSKLNNVSSKSNRSIELAEKLALASRGQRRRHRGIKWLVLAIVATAGGACWRFNARHSFAARRA